MRFHELLEKSMPLGKPVNAAGFTFGFEVEMLVKEEWWSTNLTRYKINDLAWNKYHLYFDYNKKDIASLKKEYGKNLEEIFNKIGPLEFYKRSNSVPTILDRPLIIVYDDEYIKTNERYDSVTNSFRIDLGIDLYPEETKDVFGYTDNWYIGADGSVTPSEGDDLSVEITSPILDYKTCMQWIKKIFDWMDGKSYTNNTCGFHINIGFPGKTLNRVKLLAFSGENFLKKVANRTYNKSLFGDKLKKDKSDNKSLYGSRSERFTFDTKNISSIESALTDFIDNEFNQDKSFVVNTLSYKKGYVEFRALGGENYEKKYNELVDHIKRFVTVLNIACDPNAYKEDYYKKLTKIVSMPNTDEIASGNTLERQLAKFLNDNQQDPHMITQMNIVDLAQLIAKVIKNKKPLPFGPVIKFLIKQSGCNIYKLDKYLNSEKPEDNNEYDDEDDLEYMQYYYDNYTIPAVNFIKKYC